MKIKIINLLIFAIAYLLPCFANAQSMNVDRSDFCQSRLQHSYSYEKFPLTSKQLISFQLEYSKSIENSKKSFGLVLDNYKSELSQYKLDETDSISSKESYIDLIRQYPNQIMRFKNCAQRLGLSDEKFLEIDKVFDNLLANNSSKITIIIKSFDSETYDRNSLDYMRSFLNNISNNTRYAKNIEDTGIDFKKLNLKIETAYQQNNGVFQPSKNDKDFKCYLKDSDPIKLSHFSPADAYPNDAEKKNLGGSVRIKLLIDETGTVKDVQTSTASDPIFESSSVITEAMKMKFKPAFKACNAVESEYVINVTFQMY